MNTYYKPILWVEDNIPKRVIDNEFDWEGIGKIFGDYKEYVNPYYDVLGALEYIRDYLGQFDVAVLDINLEDGIDNKDNISELLKNAKIISRKPNELGFSIFQYLLILGFPIDRIIFRTANDDTYKKYNKIFEETGFDIPNAISDKLSDGLGKRLLELYSNDNSYFKVRKIVFEAVGYWLAEKENQKDYEKLKISKSESERILHDVMMHLPLRPANSLKKDDKIFREYHAVLATLAAPFETDINLDDPYQQVMKLLRNWTAHGKFLAPDDLNERIFLLLFLTAMRAYFSPYDGDDKTRFEYENEAFNFLRNNGENHADEEWKKHIYSFYHSKYNELVLLSEKHKKSGYQFNIRLYDTLTSLGYKMNMKYGDLLEILLSYRFGVQLKFLEASVLKAPKKSGIPIYLNFNPANNEFLKGIIECFPVDAMET